MVQPASAAVGAAPGGGAATPNVVNLGTTWAFATDTSASDPGAGVFKYDNATQGSATAIYISDTADAGVDAGDVLDEISTNDYIYVQDRADKAKFHLFRVSGAPTDNTGWHTIPVSSIDIGTALEADDLCTHKVEKQAGPTPQSLALSRFQGGRVSPVGDASVDNIHGDGIIGDGALTHTGSGGGASLFRDADGLYFRFFGGTNNLERAWWSSDVGLFRADWEPACLVKFKFVDDDRSRMWIGFFETAATNLNTNDPGGDHAALRFENGDTNFRFCFKNSSQNDVGSGVTPVNGTTYYLKIEMVSGQTVMTLYDASFNVLATHTETTQSPDDASDLRWHLYTENDGVSASRPLGIYFGQVQNRKI